MSDNFGIAFDRFDYLKLFPYDHFIFFLVVPTYWIELRSIHTIKVNPLNGVFGIIVLQVVFPY